MSEVSEVISICCRALLNTQPGETVVATEKNDVLRGDWRSPTWSRFKNQRLAVLWEVVALSLGADPIKENVTRARRDEQFAEAYKHRIKLLTRMMSDVPAPGYVTVYPSHAVNKSSQSSVNRVVDFVSCIEKLSAEDDERLPKEFTDLRASLVKIPLVTNPTYQHPAAVKADRSVPKKNQSLAIQTKQREQIAAMLYAVVCDSYGYDPTDPISKSKILIDVEAALQKQGLKGKYGMSAEKIEQALNLGKSHSESDLG